MTADEPRTLILGGGVTGLGAGIAGGGPILEARDAPGGICSSYYVSLTDPTTRRENPVGDDCFRFEIGGGHWIFGGDPLVLRLLRSLGPVRSYSRRSAVFFAASGATVPYPLQHNLACLPPPLRAKALSEIAAGPRGPLLTMADWLRGSFGDTLTELFFGPFHERYTAGLWRQIAPQDPYKSPADLALVVEGAFEATRPVGYNATFLYPAHGLGAVVHEMAARCDVRLGSVVEAIDTSHRVVRLADGGSYGFEHVLSTLPLHDAVRLAGVAVDARPDPHTAVLVLNIGGTRGKACPSDHWLYVPDSHTGFHRVGFYSNVDSSFLPRARAADGVAIYVEFAFAGSDGRPPEPRIAELARQTVTELQSWGFLAEADVVDPTWIDCAYTWSWPGSPWRRQAIAALEGCGVLQVGRYGRWVFQGLADSIRDGLLAGAAVRWQPPADAP